MKKLNNKKAFTMVELLATFVILGIIMAIAIPTISYFLKGNSKDYYSKLERTVASSSQDFFNDYRVNLPKDIGNVKKIGIPTLVSQKYITDVLGIDKKGCEGDVVVQKLTNGNYSYTSCLKCEKKADGSYGYVSDFKECGYSEENNNHYTILINGLGDKTSIRIPQAVSYNIPNAKVYVNGQALSNDLKPTPSTIDVNNLTTYKIYYTFRTLVKELQIKVYDPKKPVVNISGLASGTNYSSGTYTNKDVKVSLSATDWTTSTVYGSGIDHFEYQINGGSVQKISATTSDNRNYTATFNLTANGTYNISAKAIDKEGNISDSKTFVVKIDKTTPTAPKITGGSTTWTSTKRTIRVSTDATVVSGIKNYQYYISTSSTTQSGGSWINLAAGVKQVDITTEGTRYIYFRAISNSGVEGLVSNKETTRIDKSKPTAPVITGGSTTWTSTKRTIKVSTDATVVSGIKNYQYYISTSSTTQSGGSWINLAAGVKQVDITTEGTRYIYFRAISNTGVEGLISNNQPTKIDKGKATAPKITGGSTTWTSTKRTIKVSTDATASSGIKNYQYYISTSSTTQSGGSWINLAAGVKQVDITTEGTRYIYFRAISNTGVAGAVSNYEITKIDKSGPTAPRITGGSTAWINTQRTIKVSTDATAPSGIKNYQYYISTSSTTQSGGSWINLSSGVKQVDITTEGTKYIFFRAISNTGVAGAVSTSQTTKIDKTKPVITSASGSDKWISTNTKVQINATDTLSGISKYSYDNGATWHSYNYNYFSASQTLKVAVKDKAGNIAYASFNIKVDKISPTVDFTTSDTWGTTPKEIIIKASDAESGVQKIVRQEGLCDNAGSWIPVSGTSFTASTYLNCVRVYDNAGNTKTIYAYAKIDKDPPYTPYISDESKEKMLNDGYVSIECPVNNIGSYENNYCILTLKNSQNRPLFWLSSNDNGPAGVQYKDVMSLNNGVPAYNWRRYETGDTSNEYTHTNACDKAGKCSTRIRHIDRAGNVGPGYIEVSFVYLEY